MASPAVEMKGASTDRSAVPTETLLQTSQAGPATLPDGPSPASDDAQGRFTPGAMLAGRYRIVSLLGKGGMGEVYRADDLKLGVAVALKFLPHSAEGNPGRLGRFYSEIRIGRQVSHPNVCQIYDLVEVEGHHALSMEYVDGEDLASLLRRIGRLPQDKALDVARDLCDGLAAAHDKGVLHRDLKPANIMIDGRGRARVTDFGLAALVAAPEEHILAGTPAYMAPEQLAGRPATERSDIFSLGLILLEAFTGKRPFADKSLSEIVAQQRDWEPPWLSSLVDGVDPGVDRVVRQCLARDARERPASAREVAGRLPGGDQLQAALAAGRTPSPEVVAAAGEAGDLAPAAAAACVAAFALGLAGLALLSDKTTLFRMVPTKPPAVLVDRAQGVLSRLGYADAPLDSWSAFGRERAYIDHVVRADPSPARWNALASGRPAALTFAYRQSPRYLVPWGAGPTGPAGDRDGPGWRVRRTDPPLTLAGMASLVLDGRGRLVELAVVPSAAAAVAGSAREPDWSVLFQEAGLDPAAFKPTAPRFAFPGVFDTRVAWEGACPERPELPLRVEAAAHSGRATHFALVWPWSPPPAEDLARPRPAETAREILYLLAVIAATAGAALLARRNWRLGRADRRGAFRLAACVLLLRVLAFLFGADHVPVLEAEWRMAREAVGDALFEAGQIWLFYLGLEPFVRRRWPETLISWSRLLAGRWRDPLVGRHVLFGMLFAVASQFSVHLNALAPTWFGGPALSPRSGGLPALSHWRALVADLFAVQARSIFETVGLLFLLVLLHVVLKRRRLAIGVCFLLVATYGLLWRGESLYVSLLFSTLRAGVCLWVLVRLGLLPLTVCGAVWYWLAYAPLTLDPSAWYSGLGVLVAVVLLAIAAYAFRATIGERPVFSRGLLEE